MVQFPQYGGNSILYYNGTNIYSAVIILTIELKSYII
jgi:hypothetical protein